MDECLAKLVALSDVKPVAMSVQTWNALPAAHRRTFGRRRVAIVNGQLQRVELTHKKQAVSA